MSQLIRTFVAIEIPQPVKEIALDIQDDLRNYNCRVSWTKVESMHLTLKFLGDTENNLVEKLANDFTEAVSSIESFALKTGAVGFFGGKKPRVLWLGLQESRMLSDLQQKIEDTAQRYGFAKESKRFHPHLTLGRVKDPHGTFGMMEHFNSIGVTEQKFTVSNFIFFKSELKPSGAVHTPLKTINLN